MESVNYRSINNKRGTETWEIVHGKVIIVASHSSLAYRKMYERIERALSSLHHHCFQYHSRPIAFPTFISRPFYYPCCNRNAFLLLYIYVYIPNEEYNITETIKLFKYLEKEMFKKTMAVNFDKFIIYYIKQTEINSITLALF